MNNWRAKNALDSIKTFGVDAELNRPSMGRLPTSSTHEPTKKNVGFVIELA